MTKISQAEFNKAIDMIEKNMVYRLQAQTNTGGFFTSTNGMPTAHFTNKQILEVAALAAKRPFKGGRAQ